MREIKFRGKRLDNGEWAIGLLVKMWGAWHILDWDDENTAYPVDPDTIGQYTGLKDKYGKEIREGDIIRYKEFYFVVEYKSCMAGFVASFVKDKNAYWDLNRKWVITHSVRIIGNIHDNKHLLK
ncbi:YopX family protein [Alistipes finegoldii]|uniref:YopX family protein n=1 Tax=Alistipes finegoldii TaxID=214856 RepID=UPI003AB3CBA3